ncbi:MAG: AraC family transcriptional regulator [Clostridium sp.]
MQVSTINVDKNLKEITKHGTCDLPIVVYTDDFKLFDEGYIRLHWHNELQCSYVLNEKILFFIDGKEILLEPGEGIIINSNILHQIKPFKENCQMFTINFDPIIIGRRRESIVHKKYVEPLLNSSNFKYLVLNKSVKWQQEVLEFMNEIFYLSHEKLFLYELEIINKLNLIWISILKEMKDKIDTVEKTNFYDEERVQKGLQFIHNHYFENITLDNIASESNISKSECCRSFQRILKTTPFEYLLEYRISSSLKLLTNSKESISNIALNSGFNSVSYYGKIFKKYMNCTPSEYRKISNNAKL